MHENIPYMFDFWANPFVHLLLLKSSMIQCTNQFFSFLSKVFEFDPYKNVWKKTSVDQKISGCEISVITVPSNLFDHFPGGCQGMHDNLSQTV